MAISMDRDKHTTIRRTKDKEKVRTWANKKGRKVLWKDSRGYWHAATDRNNTPGFATETEDLL